MKIESLASICPKQYLRNSVAWYMDEYTTVHKEGYVTYCQLFYDVTLYMLARYAIYMPWPCVCVRVCHKSESYRNGWVFGMGPVLHCVIRKLEHPQNEGTSLWNFIPNSGLRKFRYGKSIYFKVLSTKLVHGRSCGHLWRLTRTWPDPHRPTLLHVGRL